MKRALFMTVLLLVLLAGCYPPAGTEPGQGGTPPEVATTVPAATPEPVGTPAGTAAAVEPEASPEAEGQLTKITLAMGYIPSVQFAPFYVAQERGYFRDAGLDVTFRYGFESDLLKLIGTNQLQFMIGSGEEVILGRSQGLPVRYAMRWYRRFPVVLFAKESSGIQKPEDLEGKTVGISMLSGASYVAWQALVHATGIDPAKVNLQTIGFTQATAVSQDRVDAALDYVVNGPVQLRLAGEKVTVIPISDYADLPSNGIITNDQTIQEHPELVQGLVSATLRGLADTLAEPDAAFDISLRAVPEAAGEQTPTSRAIFDESLKLWQAEEGQLGHSDPESWAAAAQLMRTAGLIQQDVKPEDLYTNEFVK